ncbi:MAG: HAD family hydrolase [Gammaproteobacteria bacterium]|nr:HAD family hydrolase [Gammaproteobacteria bacterium]
MIEAILFDFGQTLVDSSDGFRTAERDAQRKILAELDGCAWDEFIDRYRRTRKALQDQSCFSRVQIWRTVYGDFGEEPDMGRLVTWECEYWQTVNRLTTPFPETIRVLEELQHDYRLALVSNTQGEVESEGHRLREFPGLAQFFEVIIVSGENGIEPKPASQPFRLCLERLGIVPRAAIYVGDDYRIDVSGARGVGIQPVWLKHRAVARNWPQIDTTVPVITSLDALLSLSTVLPPDGPMSESSEKRA